jgi:hypothetical protein
VPTLKVFFEAGSLKRMTEGTATHFPFRVEGLPIEALLKDVEAGRTRGKVRIFGNETYTNSGVGTPHKFIPLFDLPAQYMQIPLAIAAAMNKQWNADHELPAGETNVVCALLDGGSTKSDPKPGTMLMEQFEWEKFVKDRTGELGTLPPHLDGLSKHVISWTLMLAPGIPTVVLSRPVQAPGEDLLSAILACKSDDDFAVVNEKVNEALTFGPDDACVKAQMVVRPAGTGLGFFADTVHMTASSDTTVGTRWIMTGQMLVRKTEQGQVGPAWFAAAAAVTDPRKFLIGAPHLSTWETIQLAGDDRNIQRFKQTVTDFKTYTERARATSAPMARVVTVPARPERATSGSTAVNVWPKGGTEVCSFEDCSQRVFTGRNACLMANCGKYACMDCSSGILHGLIEEMEAGQSVLTDVVHSRVIQGPALKKDCVFDWFRVCEAHSTFQDVLVILSQHLGTLKALLDEESPRFHPWIMAVTAPRRPRVFPYITHYPRILASLAPGTLLHDLVNDGRSSMCALRSLEDACHGDDRTLQPDPRFQELYDAYKKNINLSPALTTGQWSNVTETTAEIFRVFGFHKNGNLRPFKALSLRVNDGEESKFHIDHKAFCDGFLAALVQSGTYDLCFIMNPSEVIHEDADPEFYTIPMQAGDIYLFVEEWLQYPHAAIPRKGATELNRKVLLIGGQFFPSGKPFPTHRVEELGLFYHYKEVGQALQHVLPKNAITGQYARDILDTRERKCRAFGCNQPLCEGEEVVTCRVCRQLVHAFVPQQGVVERYESITSKPRRQCSFRVLVQGERAHECYQCKQRVDVDINDGLLAERAVTGIPCCTCNQDCLGDIICYHCKLYVHDGKCSKKMQLLEGPEDKAGDEQCTMCKNCAQVASKKSARKGRPDPQPLSAGTSTGIAPLSNISMQLRSSPTKRNPKETPVKSTGDARGTANEEKATSKDTPNQGKTGSTKRKADEGIKHCMFILAPLSLSILRSRSEPLFFS